MSGCVVNSSHTLLYFAAEARCPRVCGEQRQLRRLFSLCSVQTLVKRRYFVSRMCAMKAQHVYSMKYVTSFIVESKNKNLRTAMAEVFHHIQSSQGIFHVHLKGFKSHGFKQSCSTAHGWMISCARAVPHTNIGVFYNRSQFTAATGINRCHRYQVSIPVSTINTGGSSIDSRRSAAPGTKLRRSTLLVVCFSFYFLFYCRSTLLVPVAVLLPLASSSVANDVSHR